MQFRILKFSFLMVIAILVQCGLIAQEGSDKEIIIIEKIRDENGKIISKSTKRLNGKYTEKQIQDLIDEDPGDVRSFDLEGLGFEDNFRDLFKQNSGHATIGVNLNFEDGQAIVEKVNFGSGAEEADIRVGDKLLSINGVAISSIDDIYEILDQKKRGDKVRIIIFRDGEEIEKQVKLGEGVSSFFFEFPEDGSSRLFGDNLDSLFNDFGGPNKFWKRFGFDNLEQSDLDEDKDSRSNEKPSLGIFLDDSQTEVVVAEVIKDTPASRAGLKKGDVILRLDDNLVTSYREVKALLFTKQIGDTITLDIKRNQQKMQLIVKLD